MNCQRCESLQMVHVSGTCEYSEKALASEHPNLQWSTRSHEVKIDFCQNCGQVQGKFNSMPEEHDVKVALDKQGDWVWLGPHFI